MTESRMDVVMRSAQTVDQEGNELYEPPVLGTDSSGECFCIDLLVKTGEDQAVNVMIPWADLVAAVAFLTPSEEESP